MAPRTLLRFARSFGAGLLVAALVRAVAALLGVADMAWLLLVFVAGCGLVVAALLALGVNLGMWTAIRSLDDYGRPVQSPGAAARLALGSLGVYVGALLSAAVTG